MSLRLPAAFLVVGFCSAACTVQNAETPAPAPQPSGTGTPEAPAPCGGERRDFTRQSGVSEVSLAFGGGVLGAAWMSPAKEIVASVAAEGGGEAQDFVVSKGTNPDGSMPPLGMVKLEPAADGSLGVFWSNQAHAWGRVLSNVDLEAGAVDLSGAASIGYLGAGPNFGGPLSQVAATRDGFVFAEPYTDTNRSGFTTSRFGGFVLGYKGGELSRIREFYTGGGSTVGSFGWAAGPAGDLLYVQSAEAESPYNRWRAGTVSTSAMVDTSYFDWAKEESKEKGFWDRHRVRAVSSGFVVAARYNNGTKSFLELRSYDQLMKTRADKKQVLVLEKEVERLDVAVAPNGQLAVAMIERTEGGARSLRALRLSPSYEVLSDTSLDLATSTVARAVAVKATDTELYVAAAVLTTAQGDPSKAGSKQTFLVSSQNLCDAPKAP